MPVHSPPAQSTGKRLASRRGRSLLVVAAWLLLPQVASGQEGMSLGGPPNLKSRANLAVLVRAASGEAFSQPVTLQVLTARGGPTFTETGRDNSYTYFNDMLLGSYNIEVTVPGFLPAHADAELVIEGSTATVIVLLNVDSSANATSSVPTAPLLAPKAQKELEKGVQALEKKRLPEAQERLERALALAPGNPLVHYYLGILFWKQNDLPKAREQLRSATNLNANSLAAQRALGLVLYRMEDSAGALAAFEKALELNPNLPEVHLLAASANYRMQDYRGAAQHAGRSIELGQDRTGDAYSLRAFSLAFAGEREKAERALNLFLRLFPAHPGASAARSLLERMRRSAATDSTNARNTAAAAPKVDSVTIPPAKTPTVEFSPPPPRQWAPPDVDMFAPAVLPGTTCSLPQVLGGVRKRATELVDHLERIAATEVIEHATVDDRGNDKTVESSTVQYVVNIHMVRNRFLSVEEEREGNEVLGPPNSRYMATGLGALALVFHPVYGADFEVRCDGLSAWHGEPVWLLYFRSRLGRVSRFHTYQTKKGEHTVPLKGRAWVAANSYQVVRVETSLLAQVEAIALAQEQIRIDYAPVPFHQAGLTPWLPLTAELYVELHGHRFRQKHSFSRYQLFSVDSRQTIGDPKSPR